MEPVLSLKNVYKKIGRMQIINNVSFDVYPGEIFGFLGPNGAGKTTTIRMIVGLTNVTKGDITISGQSIVHDFKKAIGHVGTIVENPEMYKYLSAEKNLIHFGRMSRNVIKEDIRKRLELVRLSHVKKQKVRKFSLGMKQRLGIAQAMLHSPDVLILDEPTNGLDPAGVREMRDYLRRVAKEENVAILISSHLLSEIELICDRFAIIQEGEIAKIENVKEETEQTGHVSTFTLEVNERDRARELVSDKFPSINVQFVENQLHLQATKDQMGEVITYLVENEIIVYQSILEKQSLEDRFFEVTNGGVS
ncbi:ABC transporter ATP-binding protein [Virgibacillus siamensis]|uniref:ABC transporter ATP-binding protein n=1 Tax=Virgibacillus siamensis TaxID=480071 RepID=UPI000987B4DA|nr:ABC transporter ATP-binding protein [Virgibacillus siamensis]